MLEQYKRVSNPLTIIALFAGLAEIAGTVALKLVPETLQPVFIWFVMMFPVLLVVLFFITLNFNPSVLYAPSDFKDDATFLNFMGKKHIESQLDSVQQDIQNIDDRIVSKAESGTGGEISLVEVVADLNLIKEKIGKAKETAAILLPDENSAVEAVKNKSNFLMLALYKEKVKGVLRNSREPSDIAKICVETFIRPNGVAEALDELVREGAVVVINKQGSLFYELSDKNKMPGGDR